MRQKVCKESNKRERERTGKKGRGFLSSAFLSVVFFFFFFPFNIGSVKFLTKKDLSSLYIRYWILKKARRGESWIY